MIDLSRYERILRETQRNPLPVGDILKFLYRYGYFSDLIDDLKNKTIIEIVREIRSGMPEFREAIRRFRDFYELGDGTDADDRVQSAMLIPRCAVPDFFPEAKQDEPAAIKNYQGSGRWPIEKMPDGVKYYFDATYPTDKTSIDAMHAGMEGWNKVCGIRLVHTKNRSEANIVITQKRIDGGGGTLALGWFPMQSSPTQTVEIRFDSGDNWSRFEFRGEVGGHEGGHVLGFNHVKQSTPSIMQAFATGQYRNPQSHDIGVAQDYYGKPIVPEPSPPVTPPTIPTEPDEPDTPTNPYSRAKLFLPDPKTGELGEYFVLPATDYGGL